MKKSDMDKLVTAVFDSNKAIVDLLDHFVTEISELQERIKRLEGHIHFQDVFQAGSTGEPVYWNEKEAEE